MNLICDLCNRRYVEGMVQSGRCVNCGKLVVGDENTKCLQFTVSGNMAHIMCIDCFGNMYK